MARLIPPPPDDASVVTFGVQHVQASYDDVLRILNHEHYPSRALTASEIEMDTVVPGERTIHQRSFLRMMGFGLVNSLDKFADEQPTLLADLNEPIPQNLGTYDLVLDGGTIEHCFNVPQALANAVHLAKIGGHVVHISPISGWIDHGFYQFSPTLFFDYYSANGFEDLRGVIVFDGRYIDVGRYIANDTHVPRQDFLGHTALLAFVARKANAVRPAQPVQRYYRELFGGEARLLGASPDPIPRNVRLRTLIRDVGVAARAYSKLLRAVRL